ncbi:hypothetical protein DFH09DRAFT_1390310 [Mycena vulgaris]|nr:hypothetical protein DFH09DRAFT_1390310 [Mycena vulgaris]
MYTTVHSTRNLRFTLFDPQLLQLSCTGERKLTYLKNLDRFSTREPGPEPKPDPTWARPLKSGRAQDFSKPKPAKTRPKPGLSRPDPTRPSLNTQGYRARTPPLLCPATGTRSPGAAADPVPVIHARWDADRRYENDGDKDRKDRRVTKEGGLEVEKREEGKGGKGRETRTERKRKIHEHRGLVTTLEGRIPGAHPLAMHKCIDAHARWASARDAAMLAWASDDARDAAPATSTVRGRARQRRGGEHQDGSRRDGDRHPGLRRAEHEQRSASSTEKRAHRRPAPDLRPSNGEVWGGGGEAGIEMKEETRMGKGGMCVDVNGKKRKGAQSRKKGKEGGSLTRLLRFPPLIPSPDQKPRKTVPPPPTAPPRATAAGRTSSANARRTNGVATSVRSSWAHAGAKKRAASGRPSTREKVVHCPWGWCLSSHCLCGRKRKGFQQKGRRCR